ncbi:protein-L-isoaspartate(D-aspartate) O-methyltransferase [Nitrosococcus watsonii]|uniref:Protein-L-isoaspartate O-methyltransferase n=1 Tax=Nitrosococcus watsoni (strain C-113) TaxID=105559 RepID=D8K6F1_NITWC|nr:protein-L-isoaspartate(D-aspartate) O-methyltransferase [Nitrosococcus watsonii]ADJ28478.1 protein-L-isoaspartate O-methyltransferase [Nitrosococcus watsonii C-113]
MKSHREMLRDIQREVGITRRWIGKESLSGRVMEAVKAVPRHEFVPDEQRPYAYDNAPLVIGCGQTISQPYIVALMTDLLDPKPEDIILEVGTGSGYQAAILSRLVKKVYTIEVIEELAQQAEARLERLGYTNVEVQTADGYFGWPEQAPFDGIMVTAAAPSIPEPLIEQLKPEARLVLPLGAGFQQELRVVTKKENNEIDTQRVLGVSFVPLTGEHSSR